MPTSDDLLSALSRAYFLAGPPAEEGPELAEAVEEVLEIQKALGWSVVRVADDGLFTGGRLVEDPEGDLRPLARALVRSGIREIRFQRVLTPDFLIGFLRHLHQPPSEKGESPSSRFHYFQGDLGLSFVPDPSGGTGVAGSVYQLFEQLVSSPGFASSTQKQAGGRPADGLARRFLSSDLASEIRLFLSAEGGIREGSRQRILEAVSALEERRDTTVVADVVELLIEGSEGAEDPESAVSLAREISSFGAANHLLARLATTRDEWERGQRLEAISLLGEKIAPVAAAALGETRDRFQRRSLLEAMVVLGPECMEVVEEMLEDSRWFVVRNGIAILGEIGSEETVPKLTQPLAHEEARVRREAALALGKLGGGDAGMLLTRVLDDPEPGVRAMACRALGTLGTASAVLRLMRLAEEDPDRDVQIDSLQALGRIGDETAVPLLEKKAVGRFFSRPQREIRVAAYRALASMGTPYCLGIVRKAAQDTDREVRAMAQALLKGM
ncbi:HEAT repeat domain-containing protein [Gemmatimonadota bacterium]